MQHMATRRPACDTAGDTVVCARHSVCGIARNALALCTQPSFCVLGHCLGYCSCILFNKIVHGHYSFKKKNDPQILSGSH